MWIVPRKNMIAIDQRTAPTRMGDPQCLWRRNCVSLSNGGRVWVRHECLCFAKWHNVGRQRARPMWFRYLNAVCRAPLHGMVRQAFQDALGVNRSFLVFGDSYGIEPIMLAVFSIQVQAKVGKPQVEWILASLSVNTGVFADRIENKETAQSHAPECHQTSRGTRGQQPPR